MRRVRTVLAGMAGRSWRASSDKTLGGLDMEMLMKVLKLGLFSSGAGGWVRSLRWAGIWSDKKRERERESEWR